MSCTVNACPKTVQMYEQQKPTNANKCIMTTQGVTTCGYDNTNHRYGENIILSRDHYQQLPGNVLNAIQTHESIQQQQRLRK
jgi:hypothetical protein